MDRWQQIEKLFLAASELPTAERAAFLDREAAGDSDLHAAVNGMLFHSDESDARFLAAVEQTAMSAGSDLAPTHIDRYTVVRELGRGGMGTVYLAERTDREFNQQVAIKIVKRGMDSAQIVARFRQERRILASLDHPNIARLFDGGATANGLPYIVMEYVEGRPLVDYCREDNLPVRERLLLFEQVCAAVQHAHQKLIVHRDIKPANIVVTPGGTPKLLDFGIAKILLPNETEMATVVFTGAGARLLTPEYASPEQIRGEPVSVATDTFSLGLVLYELITGQRAHRFKTYTESEFVRVICQTEVPPASEAAGSDARLRRNIAGDLDNIVGKALRKDPARRYVSVEQFAGDIRRYLEGRPVTARPETLLYRTRKFVTRNRLPVTAAALAALSLIGGIVGTTVQARRADAQAVKAERRFQQVRKLANTFVFEVYDGIAELPGTAKLRASVIATALEYLDNLAAEAEGDDALQMELAAAYKRIGDVQGNPARSGIGLTDPSVSSYEKGLAILRRLAARPAPEPKVLSELGTLERTLGYMRLSEGDAERAVGHQRNSVAAFERQSPRRGEDIEIDTGIAQGWGMMGKALFEAGNAAEAMERHAAAVSLIREWLPRPALPTTRGTLSLLLYDLAMAQADTGDLRGAAATYREAAQIRKEILDKAPTNLNYRRRRFSLNFELATVFGQPLRLNLGDHAIAEDYAIQVFREAEQMAEEDRGSPRSIHDRMLGNWILGCVLLPEDPRRAIPYLETALEVVSAGPDDGSADVGDDDLRAHALEALGRALLATGNRERGLSLLRRSVDLFERLSSRAPQITEYRFGWIRATNALGDSLPPPEASELYRKAFRTAAPFSDTSPRNVRELLSLAEVHSRWPRWNAVAPPAESKKMAETTVRLWEKLQSYAPANRSVQQSLAEARRSLASPLP